MSDSLQPHELQHTRLSCPSPTPRACTDSCSSSRWCHSIISSSVVPFSSCLQSFPASVSSLMNQFFTSGGQSIGSSASASYDPTNVGNLTSDFFAFSKSSLNIWKFSVHILLKPSLKDFEHYLASMGNEPNCVFVWTLALPFFGTGIKTDPFQSCGPCWVFQIC